MSEVMSWMECLVVMFTWAGGFTVGMVLTVWRCFYRTARKGPEAGR